MRARFEDAGVEFTPSTWAVAYVDNVARCSGGDSNHAAHEWAAHGLSDNVKSSLDVGVQILTDPSVLVSLPKGSDGRPADVGLFGYGGIRGNTVAVDTTIAPILGVSTSDPTTALRAAERHKIQKYEEGVRNAAGMLRFVPFAVSEFGSLAPHAEAFLMLKKRKPAAPAADKPVPELELERVIGLSPSPGALAHSPAGGDVAYCAGCVVVLFDGRANRQRAFLRAPPGGSSKPFISVAFSHDGATVAAGESGPQPAVVVWDALSGECLAQLKAHKHGIASLAFSPAGKFLVSCGAIYDGQICFWNWASKSLLARERTQVDVRSVSFSEDGGSVISAGKGHLRVWSVSQVGGGGARAGRAGGSQATVTLTGRSPVLGAYKSHTLVDVVASAGSAGGLGSPCFFAVSHKGVLMQLKTNSRSYDRSVDLKVRAAFTVAASPDIVAVGCADGIVRLFAARTLCFKATLPRPAAYGDHGLTDHRQSITTALRPGTSSLFPDAVAASFDGSGDRIAVVYADHSLFVWDVRNLSKVGRFRSMIGHAGAIWDVSPLPSVLRAPGGLNKPAPAPPPGSFATASADGTIRIWNLGASPTAAISSSSTQFLAQGSWPENAYFKPLVGVIYTKEATPAGNEHKICAEDQPVGRKGQEVPVLRCLKASPDGRQLVAGDRKGNLRVFDVAGLKEVAVLEAHDSEILSLDCSPCGMGGGFLLASGGRDHLVHVYDGQRSYQRLATLDEHGAAVTAVRFASRGNRLVSCGADRSLVFRDLQAAGEQAADVRQAQVPGRGPLYDMQLETTEKYLVATGEDKKLKVFGVENAKPVKSFSLPAGAAGEAVRIQVDPAGITLAASHSDRSVRLYDFYTGEVLGRAAGHGDVVTGMFITPDCSRLVSVAGDGCVFVWRMPPKLISDSVARLAELPVPQPQGSMALPLAAPLAADGDLRSSKKGKLLGEATPETEGAAALQKPTPPSDVESQSLTSERLRNGKALVSTRKLPKWAQAAAMLKAAGTSPAPEPGADDADGSHEASEADRPGMASKWAQRVDVIAIQNAAERRRLTVEPSEMAGTPLADPSPSASLDIDKPGSAGSHPALANAAEEDEIVYYDEEELPAGADGEGFEVVNSPLEVGDEEEEGDATKDGSAKEAEGEDDELQQQPPEEEVSPSELPRSNLFKEHFGQLLDDEPLPEPAPGSRAAARQSFSAQYRAGAAAGQSATDKPPPSEQPKPDDAALADSGADQDGVDRQRKGRMNAEIRDMRARLVDLGLCLAEQQRLARRGNLLARGALQAGQPNDDDAPGQEAETDSDGAAGLPPSEGQELFSVGATPDGQGAGMVAEAMDEMQSPASTGRLARSKSDTKRRQHSPASKGAPPPLPAGPPPASAVSMTSVEFRAGQLSQSASAAEASPDAAAPQSVAANGVSGPADAATPSAETPALLRATQYHNPAFDLTPESALKEGHHTSAAAVAALKSLQKEKAAAKLMNPGHRTVSVVYSSQEGAPQAAAQPQGPVQAAVTEATEAPGSAAAAILPAAAAAAAAAPVPTLPPFPPAPAPAQPAAPAKEDQPAAGVSKSQAKKDLAALRGARVRGLRSSADRGVKVQPPPPPAAKVIPREATKQTSQTIGCGNAETQEVKEEAEGKVERKEVGEEEEEVEEEEVEEVEEVEEGGDKENAPPAGLKEQPGGGGMQHALAQLRAAVAGVEALRPQAPAPAGGTERPGEEGEGEGEEAFQAELRRTIARLQALTRPHALSPPAPTATPSPPADLQPAAAAARQQPWETPSMFTPSISGSLNFSDISFQVESMLEGSAEKFSERYSELLAKKLEHKLQQSLQKLMRPAGAAPRSG
eukprot:jgi/Tetstr1/420914/TSEL_011976.t1